MAVPKHPRQPAFTEAEVLQRLGELERRWPKHLMLFGGPGALHLLRKDAYRKQDRNERIPESGRVASFRIPTDGGDPTFDVEH